jgi:hypothetical protein
MGLFSWLGVAAVSEADVRAEIWKLGVRHNGWPLEGALDELRVAGLTSGRADLLRACVQKLRAA